MKKILVAVAVLLSLTACEDPGDVMIRTYSGWGKVTSKTQTVDSCTLGFYMYQNGLTGKITREGKDSCTEEEGQMRYITFGRVA